MAHNRINRRQAPGLFGAAGVSAAVLGACGGSDGDSNAGPGATAASGSVGPDAFSGAASCTAGPYYIDVDNIRSDNREDRQGTPLRVAARVLSTGGCTPVKDAVFEIWHRDALGRTLNSQDGIYRKETTLTVSRDGDGYLGLITIGTSG